MPLASRFQGNLHSTEAEIGTVLMAGGLVAAIDQIIKMLEDGERGSIPIATLGAGTAFVGYRMVGDATHGHPLGHTHHHHNHNDECFSHDVVSRGREVYGSSHHEGDSRSSSTPPHHGRHHGRHLLEETVGMHGLLRELLGDRDHHGLHTAEEVLGLIGALRDFRSRIT